jgi:hypothetical protein
MALAAVHFTVEGVESIPDETLRKAPLSLIFCEVLTTLLLFIRNSIFRPNVLQNRTLEMF